MAIGPRIRTRSQIRQAHQRAVGGMRKRCKKGKNCSAACIQGSMACLVELPIPPEDFKKVSRLINSAKGVPGTIPIRSPLRAKSDPVIRQVRSEGGPAVAAEVKPKRTYGQNSIRREAQDFLRQLQRESREQRENPEDYSKRIKERAKKVKEPTTPKKVNCGGRVVDTGKCRQTLSPANQQATNEARKDVEKASHTHQHTEALVAAVLLGKPINSKADLAKAIEEMDGINLTEKDRFIAHLDSKVKNKKQEERLVEYAKNIREQFKDIVGQVDHVSVAGGSQRRLDPRVAEVDKGLNARQQKSDIYVWVKGKPIGISVKDDPGAQLTNFGGVEKLNSELKQMRIAMLEEAGFNKKWKTGLTPDERKAIRTKMNDLFRGGQGPYWEKFREVVNANQGKLLKEVLEGYTAHGAPFKIVETDGKNLYNLKDEYAKMFNPNSKLEMRVLPHRPGAVAMDTGIFLDGKQIMQGEIRWKGDMFGTPEFVFKRSTGDNATKTSSQPRTTAPAPRVAKQVTPRQEKIQQPQSKQTPQPQVSSPADRKQKQIDAIKEYIRQQNLEDKPPLFIANQLRRIFPDDAIKAVLPSVVETQNTVNQAKADNILKKINARGWQEFNK